jgi:multidrug efflux pump
VASVFTVNGFNFAGRGQSSGLAFIMLKPWDERDASNSVFALAQRAQQHFFSFRDAMVFAFAPPAVLELGNATGFDVFLQDRAGIGHEKLMEARNQFLGLAAQSKVLYQVRPNGLNDEPQYHLEIDDEKAQALGLTCLTSTAPVDLRWVVATSTTSSTVAGLRRFMCKVSPVLV